MAEFEPLTYPVNISEFATVYFHTIYNYLVDKEHNCACNFAMPVLIDRDPNTIYVTRQRNKLPPIIFDLNVRFTYSNSELYCELSCPPNNITKIKMPSVITDTPTELSSNFKYTINSMLDHYTTHYNLVEKSIAYIENVFELTDVKYTLKYNQEFQYITDYVFTFIKHHKYRVHIKETKQAGRIISVICYLVHNDIYVIQVTINTMTDMEYFIDTILSSDDHSPFRKMPVGSMTKHAQY